MTTHLSRIGRDPRTNAALYKVLTRRGARGSWFSWTVAFGAGALAAWATPRALAAIGRQRGARELFDAAAQLLDQRFGWDRLPVPIALATIVGLRHRLRADNLHDTGPLPNEARPAPPPPADASHLTTRTADGTFNDLDNPTMGSAGTRFGRNAPIQLTYPDPTLLSPSPRAVSLDLMTRHRFQPATTLNLLAAAWLQFIIRDWFSHGRSPTDNPWLIPLGRKDDWYENPMRIMRTAEDPTRTAVEANLPPTYLNHETHWWDASQLYGNTREYQSAIRTGERGRVHLQSDGLVRPSEQALVVQSNLAGWWVGLEILFTLFAREHNAICEHLAGEYPNWSDEQLFQRARLVNAALLAKIHTVEWTTAILGHPALQVAMRANWWGVLGKRIHNLLGRVSGSEVLSGIPGSRKDHFGVPYAITEEFVAAYRMHPLIRDDLQFRSARTNQVLGELGFQDTAGLAAHGVAERYGMYDLLYSFGLMHPGAVVLHNFPRALQKFTRPDGVVVDLAATDVLRTRELGVPRYAAFRRMLHRPVPRSFEELTPNPQWREEIRALYDNDLEQVDTMVGFYAERFPKGFGFSDTAFRIFILMAARRLNSDRFFTTDFTPAVYSPAGMQWINDNDMRTVLLRHYPNLAPALRGVTNAFAPWQPVGP
jgi:hypothetical protein